ncbi:unnamed protein product [Durusdinium trenchii]|uniref:Anaphase-promoting complex subunit 4 WD40 domain-containing protein n=1 Tax=Durusdinium trenchii TaxID=1381693 RepID=A0ABP0PB41_9DINO
MTLPASHVDLDDLDPVSDDEVPPDENDDAMGTTMLSGVDGLDGSASDLRVELAVPQEVEDIPAPLLVEADAQLDMSQHALEMDYDDEVLQIGELTDPWIDPDHAEQDARMEKAFGITDGEDRMDRDREAENEVKKDYVRGFKRSGVYAMDWAGDKLLVAAKEGPGLRLHDVERGEEERTWSGEWMSIRTDPNNPFLAAGVDWRGKFKLFDTRHASQSVFDVDLKKTSPSMKDFLYLCWSPDSTNIALSNRADHIYCLHLKMVKAKENNSLRLGSSKMNMNIEVNQMVYSPSGDSLWVATGGTPGKLQIFPSNSLQTPERSVVAHNWTAISLARDPTGKYICSGGADGLITVWEPRQPLCLRCFLHPGQVISNVDFNYQGSLIAWGTGAGERSLTLMGANTAIPYYQDLTPATVTQLRWHSSKNVLAYSLNASQMSDDRPQRDRRGYSKDTPIIQLLKARNRRSKWLVLRSIRIVHAGY